MGGRTRGTVAIVAVIAFAILMLPALAVAYDENVPPPAAYHGDPYPGYCNSCHLGSCGDCHASHGVYSSTRGKGPHGSYTTSTSRCAACHTTHAAGGPQLLPGATVISSCNTCHDGTGGHGVYGSIAARGMTAAASHRIDVTSIVPGGNGATGGNATIAFSGPGGTLSCDDCHSPHDANTVAAFTGDRQRTYFAAWPMGVQTYATNRLLKQRPGDATESVAAYGSDWCLACHRGRNTTGALHNHPVESTATVANPYTYNNLPIAASDLQTATTVLGSLGRSNRGFLMAYPRTAQQTGHLPICQQCHEDTRYVGDLSATGSDAATFTISSVDGTTTTDNPRFQNFPHESVNTKMLVETNDDLCLNCHLASSLP